jgi:hypothetical protein
MPLMGQTSASHPTNLQPPSSEGGLFAMQNISHNQLLVLWELVHQAIDQENLRIEVEEEQGIECTVESLEDIAAGLHVYIKDAALLERHDSLSHGTSM